jgi:hypothetical protein
VLDDGGAIELGLERGPEPRVGQGQGDPARQVLLRRPAGGLLLGSDGLDGPYGALADDRALGRRRGPRIGAIGATAGAGEQREDGET